MTKSTASTARRAFLHHPMHQSSMVTDVLLRRSKVASFYRFIGSASLLLPQLHEGFNGALTMSSSLLCFDKQFLDDEN